MKVKLDENIGQSVRRRLTDAGHDVSTIVDQDMTGAPGEVVYQTCAAEGRTLVTFDLDVANPFVFDPRPTAGIVVLRLPHMHGPSDVAAVVDQLVGVPLIGTSIARCGSSQCEVFGDSSHLSHDCSRDA